MSLSSTPFSQKSLASPSTTIYPAFTAAKCRLWLTATTTTLSLPPTGIRRGWGLAAGKVAQAGSLLRCMPTERLLGTQLWHCLSSVTAGSRSPPLPCPQRPEQSLCFRPHQPAINQSAMPRTMRNRCSYFSRLWPPRCHSTPVCTPTWRSCNRTAAAAAHRRQRPQRVGVQLPPMPLQRRQW